MDLGLKGKRVLVTGGTRGIGAAIVDRFLEEGASVAFCARQPHQVLQRTTELKKKGFSVDGAVCDVSDLDAYLAWIDRASHVFGGVDIFIPNVSAGAGQGEEGWKAAFDVDLMATVRGCEALMPRLAQTGGSIVVIASIAGLVAFGGASPYNTAKAGLNAYASQLGETAAHNGVRVNTVSPGPIHVDDGFWGQVKQGQAETYAAVCGQHPFGRLGTADEVAACVVFLASPAASWVVRSNLVIDGGMSPRVQF